MKNITILLVFTLGFFSCTREEYTSPCFLIATEPTQNSIILQARMNTSDTLVEDDIPGMPSEIIFDIATDTAGKIQTAGPVFGRRENDFIAKHKFTGLLPGTEYFYRIRYVFTGNKHGHSPWQRFKTLNETVSKDEFSFVMVTGMNFHRFRTGLDQGRRKVREGGNEKVGFPGYLAIMEKQPDFFIGNGDNVYYDHPRKNAAESPEEMRKFWHRLYQMENFKKMTSGIPVYWMKDDHDYRFNDADTMNIDAGGDLLLPTHEDGMYLFYEQASFSTDEFKNALPYRTFVLNDDVQIWMVEGRDYRSPNNIPDGPGKSIWGEKQKTWLKESLLASDAHFKLLISPTPMVGPDDGYKKDNHTNPGGFRYERDQFVNWLRENDILGKGFYVLCGDRHWQYHSLHPNGLEEFSCGALVDANSRLGREPGDPESTDPEGKIQQFYTQQTPSGGFLEVEGYYANEKPLLKFSFYDEKGELLYDVEKQN